MPEQMNMPVRIIPVSNIPISAIAVMSAGRSPPPIKNARGTAREMTTFRADGTDSCESRAKPAGKKQTASNGWRKMAVTSKWPSVKPITLVVRPVMSSTQAMVFRLPKLSASQPPSNAVPSVNILDRPTSRLASSRDSA